MSEQHQPTGQQTGQYSQPTSQGTQPTGQGMGQQSMSQQPQGMSQQPMGPQSQGMGQQPMGQQMGQQGSQFHSTLPTEFRTALEDFAMVTQIAEWCADKCIDDPQMAECARACEDLADLAELNEKLIARDSIHGPQVAEAYLQVAQQALPTLQQFEQSPHVSETLSAVTRSLDSINQLFSSIGYQPTSQAGGGGMGQPQGMSQQPQGMGQQSQGMGQQAQQSPIGQGSFQQGSY